VAAGFYPSLVFKEANVKNANAPMKRFTKISKTLNLVRWRILVTAGNPFMKISFIASLIFCWYLDVYKKLFTKSYFSELMRAKVTLLYEIS